MAANDATNFFRSIPYLPFLLWRTQFSGHKLLLLRPAIPVSKKKSCRLAMTTTSMPRKPRKEGMSQKRKVAKKIEHGDLVMYNSFIFRRRQLMHRQEYPVHLVLLAVVMILGIPAFGQTAAITGVITDAKAGAVGDATVTARNVNTGIKIEAPTNYEGYYTFPRLNPGNYELTVRKSGFRAATRPAFKLDVGQVARVDVTRTVGDVSQSVTVMAEAPIVASETATLVHGALFEFVRSQLLDARNFFNATSVRPAVKLNQFGFTLGGPFGIPRLYNGRDKTFIFGDYEGTRGRSAVTNNNLVPTAAQQQGNFSSLSAAINDPLVSPKVPIPGNIIPASRLSPQSAFFLPFYPQANTASGLFNYVPSSRNTVDKFDTRVDHYFSRADSLTGTYSFNQVLNYAPGAFPANGAVIQAVRRQAAALSETHSFGPSTLNELRLNYVRTRESNSAQGLGTNYTVQSGIGGFTEQSSAFPGFPGLSISGYLGFNENAFVPIIFRDNTREISDSVTWLHGAHMFKAGGLFRYYDTATVNAAHSRGNFIFNTTYPGNSFADFLLGLPFQAQRTFPRNEFGIAPMRNEHVFFQDDWKIARTLTLNLGLRYEVNNRSEERR